jgi:hypothetical protein
LLVSVNAEALRAGKAVTTMIAKKSIVVTKGNKRLPLTVMSEY